MTNTVHKIVVQKKTLKKQFYLLDTLSPFTGAGSAGPEARGGESHQDGAGGGDQAIQGRHRQTKEH